MNQQSPHYGRYSCLFSFRQEYNSRRTSDQLWVAVNGVRYSTQRDNYLSLLIKHVARGTATALTGAQLQHHKLFPVTLQAAIAPSSKLYDVAGTYVAVEHSPVCFFI